MALDPALQQQITKYAQDLATRRQSLARSTNDGRAANLWNESASYINTQGLPDILKYADQLGLQATDMPLIQKYLDKDPTAQENILEQAKNAGLRQQQDQQLQQYSGQVQNQLFGGQLSTAAGDGGMTLAQALQSNTGALGNLNSFLGQQTADTFNNQLKPLIQSQLGAQGLGDSGGAQVELQSKALAQLEQQRQQSMMQAALGALGQVQGLNYSNLQQGIGQTQQNAQQSFDLNRMGITMQFQRELEAERAQLAQQLSSYKGSAGGAGIGSMVGGGIGAVAGGIYGGPAGAVAGYGAGSALGGSIGGMVSPPSNGGGGGYGGYGGGSNLSPAFFAASSSMPKTWSSSATGPGYAPASASLSGSSPMGGWNSLGGSMGGI